MRRFFNIAGPCDARRHYMLPPEARLSGADLLVERGEYFVLHAPRQVGKTTAMRALAARLRDEGYVAVYASLETSQGFEDVERAEPLWIEALQSSTEFTLPESELPPNESRGTPGARLKSLLLSWCEKLAGKPLVLLLDEADCITGPAMVSFLRQLRAGYTFRIQGKFPHAIALIGMRDLRDYLLQAKDGVPVNPGSPFNVKSASLTMRNFNETDVADLLAQHTADTGQVFTPEALNRVCWWTRGQPFLVNALARILMDDLVPDRAMPITAEHVDEAKEKLIHARTTHLDSLARRLDDPRIAAIVKTILLGDEPGEIDTSTDDWELAVDLGLVGLGSEGPQAANPMYREILVRQLSRRFQDNLPLPWWPWRTPDGGLDMAALVDAFLTWWRRNADLLLERDRGPYREAVAHLAFMGFVQRVVNAGGQVLREYAAGRGRVDVFVQYGGGEHASELKRVPPRHLGLDTVRSEGIAQLSGYLGTLGLDEGWLIVFDQRPDRTWDERMWREDLVVDGRTLHLRGA
jgi:hypothetical protein